MDGLRRPKVAKRYLPSVKASIIPIFRDRNSLHIPTPETAKPSQFPNLNRGQSFHRSSRCGECRRAKLAQNSWH